MFAIQTTNLTKCFNGFKAVDALDLNVPAGSIFGFLGPNGAGKTTTIKMLTGLTNPSSGEIKIFDKTVKFGSMKGRTDTGYLPEVPGFYDWMTPVEFLMFLGELFSIDKETLKNRVGHLLDLVGLDGVKKKTGSFSRGMKQRLGIAQALINDPKIVFFDEPTSALDPIGRKEVLDIIAKLSGKITVFLSTHILSDIERVCDRVAILDKGRLQIEDEITNLRRKYALQGIALELELNGKSELDDGINELIDAKKEFTEVLRRQKWVVDVVCGENGEVKVYVNDMMEAQIDIPGIIHEKKLALRKFATLEPTLEDIFLKVVRQK